MAKPQAKRGPVKPRTGNGGRRPLPGWLWMLTGLLLGLLVALLAYLYRQPPHPIHHVKPTPPANAKPAPKPVAPKAGSKPSEKPAPEAKKSGINFDFYRILPKMEVIIPKADLDKPQNAIPNASYLVQVASFRRDQDAEALRAKLILLNFAPKVQSIDIDGETWHRVQLGPFTDRREMDKLTRRLQDNNVNYMIVREKKP